MELTMSEALGFGLAFTVAVGTFAFMVVRMLFTHKQQLTTFGAGQTLIIEKLDEINGSVQTNAQEIAISQNDIKTIYKRMDRECA